MPKVTARRDGVAIFTALASLLFIVSCSGSKFKGSANQNFTNSDPAGTSSDPAAIVSPGSDAQLLDGSDTFKVEIARNKLDIVWVIDNSISMGEEAAQVRKNFESFINKVSSIAETKIALISALPSNPSIAPDAAANTAVALPESARAKGHIQIDQYVGSTNLLALAGAASCPAESSRINVTPSTTTNRHHRICNLDFKYNPTEAFPLFFEDLLALDKIKGSLSSFLRPDAKRIYIFVTDDNSLGVKGDKFVPALQTISPALKPFAFAFRGVADQGSCVIARPGLDYDILTKSSGGDVYDICAADWEHYFNKLLASVSEIVKTQYGFSKGKVEKIKSVTIDDKELDPQYYSLKEEILTIDARVIQDGQKILVSYTYRE